MKAIIFSHLYERGREVFEQNEIEFIICPQRKEEDFLSLQQEHQAMAVVVDSRPLSKNFFCSLLPRTLIARFGTGVDNILLDKCQKMGHWVANTPGASTSSVCEYVFATMGMLSLGIWVRHQEIMKQRWIRPAGQELRKKKLAVLGIGNIGLEVARVGKIHHQMEVIGLCKKNQVNHKIKELDNRKQNYFSTIVDDLEECISDADFITIHLSLNPETLYLINKDTLRYCKPEAFIINTARGKHIREIDLWVALHRKEIAGAVLDVFEQEPYTSVEETMSSSSIDYCSDLRKLPNVILTPHIAGNTVEANRNTARLTIDNIKAFYHKRIHDICLIKDKKKLKN